MAPAPASVAGDKAHKIASVPGRTPPLRPPGASGCEHGGRRGCPASASQDGHTRRSASRRQRNSRGRTSGGGGDGALRAEAEGLARRVSGCVARRVTSPQRGAAPERAAKAAGERQRAGGDNGADGGHGASRCGDTFLAWRWPVGRGMAAASVASREGYGFIQGAAQKNYHCYFLASGPLL